jgi:hypothetical protein
LAGPVTGNNKDFAAMAMTMSTGPSITVVALGALARQVALQASRNTLVKQNAQG